MPKACEIKRGDVVAIQGSPCMLEELKVSTPSVMTVQATSSADE